MNFYFIFRLVVNILLLFAIINGWWFFAIPLVVIGFWSQYFYIEGLLAGVFFDGLFGMTSSLKLWGYIGTIVSVFIWVLIKILKKVTRK